MRWERPSWWLAAWLLASMTTACGPRVEVEDLPPATETIAAVALRLGRAKAPGELTEAAARGERVLGLLTRDERWALGRNAIRFRVDRPVIVDIAAPSRSVPFWLADRGFAATGDRLRNEDGDFAVYRKAFPAGVIGLGVNGLDRTARSHYAVFLRAPGGGRIRVEAIDPPRLGSGLIRPGLSPFHDAEKPFDAIPPGWEGSTVVRTAFEGRHDGAIARGRVWKTRQPSGPAPDQVVVSFGEDPTRHLSFTWRTDRSARQTAVRLAPEVAGKGGPPDPESVAMFRGDDHPVESEGLLNDPLILRHRAVARGLRPDTRYSYSVGDPIRGVWSDWRTVRTAPDSNRDFSFLYLGDAQCGLERWGELLHAAHRRRPDAGFLLIAGDLVDRGNERSNWDHFFHRAAGVFDEVPFMPCVGNHEYLDKGPAIYRATFDVPPNGPPEVDPNLVYSFEYADAFIAVLDSNLGIHDPRLAEVQARWLDRALARTRATWKFVAFHHPVYASHLSRENPQLGAAWGPVFDKHHVDLVLQGHDHAYLRTRPMRGGRAVESPTEGTVYVVAVSGEKFYEQDPRDYTARGITNLATYQTIDVQTRQRRLTYRSIDRDGREVDRLVIDKGADSTRLAGPIGR
jgi:hypothetical protein